MKKQVWLIALVLMFLFVSACGDNSPFSFLKSGKPKSTTGSTTTTTQTSQPVVSNKPIKGPLLAQVNDWRIGLDDFESRLKTLKDAGMDMAIDKKTILNELVNLVILSQVAEKDYRKYVHDSIN